VIKLEWGC